MSAEEVRQPYVVSDSPFSVDQPEERETQIDLVELFFRLLESVKYIILATVLGAILLGLYTFFLVTPQYRSTAKLYVLNSSDSVLNLSDFQVGSYLASDYQEVFKTWEVNERVIANLGLDYSYTQLQEMVTVSNPSNTRILYITVQSADPAEAAVIANEYADVVREYIAETMATEKPNILSSALESIKPVSPNKTLNVLLGAFAGAVIAVIVIVVLYLLDDKIKSTDDIARYAGIPTLSVVPVQGAKVRQKASKAGQSKRKADGR